MSDDQSAQDRGEMPAEQQPAPEEPPAPEVPPAPEEPSVAPVPPPPAPEPGYAPAPPPPAYVPPPPPPPYAPPVEVMPQRPAPATESSKILAALSYIFAVIAVVVLFVEPYKDEKFVRFHAVQAIGLWIAGIVVGVVGQIPILGWLVAFIGGIALLIAMIAGAVRAFQGQYWEIPLVYDAVKGFIER